MEDLVKQSIASLNNTIIANVKVENNVFEAPFNYLLGDFSHFGFVNVNNFKELLNQIDSSAEVSQGFGYERYIQKLADSINASTTNNSKFSFLIPLRHNKVVGNFFMSLANNDGILNIMFVYLDVNNLIFNFSTFVASSFKDRLTGLFNFETFQKHLTNRDKDGYLVLFDLNNFKKVNDNYGHEFGDIVLDKLAGYIISISTQNEIYYRRSGDEFFIYVLKHDYKYLLSVIGRITSFLDHLSNTLIQKNKDISCSASFGVVEVIYSNYLIDNETFINLTDLAMYQAKKNEAHMHYISNEDASAIVKQGNLKERLSTLIKETK